MKKILFAFSVLLAIAACTKKPVTAFDQVEDGSRYLPTAKKTMVSTNRLFGDTFDAFKTINSDEKNRERLRAEGLTTYAKKNGLAVTLYQDYGWPAKKLKE